MTLKYAFERTNAILAIRADHSDRFVTLDQGDEVVCPNGEIGVITTIIYNPDKNTYFIIVSYRATSFTTADPNCLSLVKRRDERYVSKLS